MTKVINGSNDLKTLRADLTELMKYPRKFRSEIAECREEIARRSRSSNMNIYSVYCNAGRYDLNALVQANTLKAAKNKVGKQLPHVATFSDVNYKVKSARLADAEFIKEMDLQSTVRTLRKGGRDKVVVYDEGT